MEEAINLNKPVVTYLEVLGRIQSQRDLVTYNLISIMATLVYPTFRKFNLMRQCQEDRVGVAIFKK
jgi:hypothetical protein